MASLRPVTDSELEYLKGSSRKPVVVDFWATWCTGCKAYETVLQNVIPQFSSKLEFTSVDVGSNPLTATKVGVMSLPTLVVFKDNRVIGNLAGACSITTVTGFLERVSRDSNM